MDLLSNLFKGFPEYWGGGVAHSVLIVSLVMTIGLLLGKLKIRNISLGLAWVLFVGILFGRFGLTLEPNLLHFIKELGLIIFVFAIGLQVGPGFFASFRRGGFALNGLMMIVLACSVAITLIIHFISNIPMTTMAGIFSGAVTNTPALGAAQQATTDVFGYDAPKIAIGYAVTYPMGVIGVIVAFAIMRYAFRINLKKEEHDALRGLGSTERLSVHQITIEVNNSMIDGKMLSDIRQFVKREFVITRIVFNGEEDECHIVSGNTILHNGDKLLVVITPKDEDAVKALFGHSIAYDWSKFDNEYKVRRLFVSNNKLNGKTIKELNIRTRFNANIAKVTRNGVDHVATPNFALQTGDILTVVGQDNALTHTESEVIARNHHASYGDLIPIFVGITFGCILAHLPFIIPGLPQPIKFGLAGGPMIIAILMGYFGTKHHWLNIATFTSGNMLREIGITMFLACVGLQAGKDFIDTVVTSEGLEWALYGLAITMIPIIIGGIIGRYVMHLNYFTLMGILSGGNTNPPALAYANEYTSTDEPSIGYTMVYPLAMILRIIVIQILIMAIA